MATANSPCTPEDHDPESRHEQRWIVRRMAFATIGDTEYPAVTGDLSSRGMQLALVGAEPCFGEPVTAEVALERDVVEARGTIAYVLPRPWGSLVGVHCPAGYGLGRACATRGA